MIKLAIFHQLMNKPWHIVTQSNSEKHSPVQNIAPPKHDTDDQGIQLQPWKIVTAVGLGPVWVSVNILHEIHLPDSPYCYFEKVD